MAHPPAIIVIVMSAFGVDTLSYDSEDPSLINVIETVMVAQVVQNSVSATIYVQSHLINTQTTYLFSV